MISALYIHLPFCRRICPFCTFTVHGHQPERRAPYLSALLTELRLRSQKNASRLRLRSIYLGGGTPSLWPIEELSLLLNEVRRRCIVHGDAEICLELNPEDVNEAYLVALEALGITRFSLGVQSFSDVALAALGRHHNAEASWRAVHLCRKRGLNYNIDLLCGALPDQFLQDVTLACRLHPPHLSLYGMEIEGNAISRLSRDEEALKRLAITEDARADALRRSAIHLRRAGYLHDELSNFCLPGRQGRQNRLIWAGADYLGLGVGAHSLVDGRRFTNESRLRAYQDRLSDGQLPEVSSEPLDAPTRANELMMIAFRRPCGLDVVRWQRRFGVRWNQAQMATIARWQRHGLLRRRGGHLQPTARGLWLADSLASALFVDGTSAARLPCGSHPSVLFQPGA